LSERNACRRDPSRIPGASQDPQGQRTIEPHAKAATLLKVLANGQRLMILCNLMDEPLTVGADDGKSVIAICQAVS